MPYPRVVVNFVVGCFFIAIQGCSKAYDVKQEVMLIESVEQAKQMIEQYHGKAVDFILPISQNKSLTLRGENVSQDVAMAIITDDVLAKGWMPNGFREKDQIRYYRYSQ